MQSAVLMASGKPFLPRDAIHKRGLWRHAVSVRLSVHHFHTFCQNEQRYLQNYFTVGKPRHSSFTVPNVMAHWCQKLESLGCVLVKTHYPMVISFASLPACDCDRPPGKPPMAKSCCNKTEHNEKYHQYICPQHRNS